MTAGGEAGFGIGRRQCRALAHFPDEDMILSRWTCVEGNVIQAGGGAFMDSDG